MIRRAPSCLRERVERLPIPGPVHQSTRVYARSANEGSGTVGWSLAGPVPACFLMGEKGIIAVSGSLNNRIGSCTWRVRTEAMILRCPIRRSHCGLETNPSARLSLRSFN
jgi:hypothetical protein